MQRCVQVKALFNTIWRSPYSPDGPPICLLFFLWAFVFSLSFPTFKTAVHLFVQFTNWALSLTGPLVNSDHWNPFNRATFQHLVFKCRFYYRNHRLLPGNDLLLSLRLLNEADRGKEKKKCAVEKQFVIQGRGKYKPSTLFKQPFLYRACNDIILEFL